MTALGPVLAERDLASSHACLWDRGAKSYPSFGPKRHRPESRPPGIPECIRLAGRPQELSSCTSDLPSGAASLTTPPAPQARCTVVQEAAVPSPRVAAGRGKKEDRLQLARETDLLVPISPPRTPLLPPSLPEAGPRGLGVSQKSQATSQGRERGEVRSPNLAGIQPLQAAAGAQPHPSQCPVRPFRL